MYDLAIKKLMAGQKLSQAEYQAIYNFGIRAKGFSLSTTSDGGSIQLTLAGWASEFTGIALRTSADDGLFVDTNVSLEINNSLVLDAVDAGFLADNNSNPRSFVPLVRPLTGQDTINFRVSNTTTQTISIIVYYRQGQNQSS